jgi:hypothetical protein
VPALRKFGTRCDALRRACRDSGFVRMIGHERKAAGPRDHIRTETDEGRSTPQVLPLSRGRIRPIPAVL